MCASLRGRCCCPCSIYGEIFNLTLLTAIVLLPRSFADPSAAYENDWHQDCSCDDLSCAEHNAIDEGERGVDDDAGGKQGKTSGEGYARRKD